MAEVDLIIPLYNEEEMLPILISELEAFKASRSEDVSVLFVNDGSVDQSLAVVQELTSSLNGYRVISFSRNFGHQKAVTAGINLSTADAVIVMDADLQDPLDVAGLMLDKWKEGYDVVYGVREDREGVPVAERVTAHWFYRLFRSLSGINAPVDTGDFRLLSRPVVEAFNSFSEQQPYVRGLVAWLGFNQVGIPYSRPGRKAGTTKYPMKKRFRLAMDSLTAFSSRPLEMAVKVGLFVSGGSVLGLVWVVLTKYLFGTAITGWASLIFAAFFFGGIQLFFLGMVGLYVARVYEEVKGRPRYVISDVWNSGSNNESNVLDRSKQADL